jgi:hypothetical protein
LTHSLKLKFIFKNIGIASLVLRVLVASMIPGPVLAITSDEMPKPFSLVAFSSSALKEVGLQTLRAEDAISGFLAGGIQEGVVSAQIVFGSMVYESTDGVGDLYGAYVASLDSAAMDINSFVWAAGDVFDYIIDSPYVMVATIPQEMTRIAVAYQVEQQAAVASYLFPPAVSSFSMATQQELSGYTYVEGYTPVESSASAAKDDILKLDEVSLEAKTRVYSLLKDFSL